MGFGTGNCMGKAADSPDLGSAKLEEDCQLDTQHALDQ